MNLLRRTLPIAGLALLLLLPGCTQDAQNEIGRSVQNWTGTDGVLDIYAGEKLTQRFIKVDKMTTARESDAQFRPYRYGYGYIDTNFNYKVDTGEKRVYFEVGSFGTNYVFYENIYN
ncbi:MAG: hypothetical protein AB7G75_00790 [Candidatus Binatia bacterium]